MSLLSPDGCSGRKVSRADSCSGALWQERGCGRQLPTAPPGPRRHLAAPGRSCTRTRAEPRSHRGTARTAATAGKQGRNSSINQAGRVLLAQADAEGALTLPLLRAQEHSLLNSLAQHSCMLGVLACVNGYLKKKNSEYKSILAKQQNKRTLNKQGKSCLTSHSSFCDFYLLWNLNWKQGSLKPKAGLEKSVVRLGTAWSECSPCCGLFIALPGHILSGITVQCSATGHRRSAMHQRWRTELFLAGSPWPVLGAELCEPRGWLWCVCPSAQLDKPLEEQQTLLAKKAQHHFLKTHKMVLYSG